MIFDSNSRMVYLAIKNNKFKSTIQNNNSKNTRLVSDGGHATHQQLQKATFAPATTTVQRGTRLSFAGFASVLSAEHKPPCRDRFHVQGHNVVERQSGLDQKDLGQSITSKKGES
jgi:hypothetical protein